MEKKMGEDFRFNHRLESACVEDSTQLCSEVCTEGMRNLRPCGGKVLHCLIKKESQVKSRACKKEVSYYIKMEVCSLSHRLCLPMCLLCLRQGLVVWRLASI